MLTGIKLGNMMVKLNIPMNQLPQDGAKLVRAAEATAAMWLKESAEIKVDGFRNSLIDQVMMQAISSGHWPVVMACFMIPRMAQNEEKFSFEEKSEVWAHDIMVMNSAIEELERMIKERPNASRDYFRGGIDGNPKARAPQ